MSEVQRYTNLGGHLALVGARGGAWVRYKDHAARIEELERENERLREALSALVAAYPYDDMGMVAILHDDARAALKGETTPPAP